MSVTFTTGTLLQSLLLVLLCFLNGEARGQSCVPFNGSPATGGKCDTIITFANVYLPPGQHFQQVDEVAANSTRLFGSFVPSHCRTAALYLICLSNFPFCHVDPSIKALLVLPPCRSVCEKMVEECRDTFTELNMQAKLPDCSQVINSTLGGPIPAFPDDSTGMCYLPAEQTVPPYSEVDCPYPLSYDEDASPDDPSELCPAQCPLPIFSDAKWWAGYITSTCFSGVGFLLTFFLCLTWILNPKKRRYPAVLPLWIAFCSMFVSVAALLSILVGGLYRNVCTWDDTQQLITFDNARENGGQGVVCILQGCLWLFFGLAASFWWVAMAFNIFEMIVLQIRKEVLDRMYYLYHILAWGIPLISVVIVLAAGKVQATPVNIQCWLTSPWDWGLYFSWVILNQLIGTILVMASIWRVVRVRWVLKGQSVVKPEHILRLSLFLVGYWAVWAYLISARSYIENSSKMKTKSYQAMLTMKPKSLLSDQGTPLEEALEEQVMCSAVTGTECELSYTLNYGAWYILAIAQGSHGIIVFVCLGLSKETFKFWIRLLRNWRDPWPVISGAAPCPSSSSSAHRGAAGKTLRSNSGYSSRVIHPSHQVTPLV